MSSEEKQRGSTAVPSLALGGVGSTNDGSGTQETSREIDVSFSASVNVATTGGLLQEEKEETSIPLRVISIIDFIVTIVFIVKILFDIIFFVTVENKSSLDILFTFVLVFMPVFMTFAVSMICGFCFNLISCILICPFLDHRSAIIPKPDIIAHTVRLALGLLFLLCFLILRIVYAALHIQANAFLAQDNAPLYYYLVVDPIFFATIVLLKLSHLVIFSIELYKLGRLLPTEESFE